MQFLKKGSTRDIWHISHVAKQFNLCPQGSFKNVHWAVNNGADILVFARATATVWFNKHILSSCHSGLNIYYFKALIWRYQWRTNVIVQPEFALITIEKYNYKYLLPGSHTLSTQGCHGMLLALHRSWSSPLGTQSTPPTRWRAPTSSLSSGPLLYSHAGMSTLV